MLQPAGMQADHGCRACVIGRSLPVCKQGIVAKTLSVVVGCTPPVCQQVMVSGLDDAPAAVPPDPAECFTAAEALLPGKVPQPKPGEPQVIVL